MSVLTPAEAAFSPQEAARVDAQVDWVVIPLFVVLLGSVFAFQFALLVGDWDYWIDWRDRRYWPLVTPLVLVILPGVFGYAFWHLLRIPLGATLSIIGLTLTGWLSRYLNFHEFAGFPMNMVLPSTFIGVGLLIDCTLLLTRSWFFTGIFAGFLSGLLLYPMNWPLLAPFMVPVEMHGTLMTVADVMGFEYIRTAMPEYVRIIEQSTLRTFGDAVTPLTAVFAGFLTILSLWFWAWVGSLGVKAVWLRKVV
ncbi:MAG: methane monooxygenase/ammonia monooxygenase subunit A [Hydrogenophaga sp.]|jgi:methane/ammonia monooxygenase subunit A|uniref:methane monooxygenase/ammonia monooxygenase subunit A n=1 Tax=unclassified Polaromonas TaxID=2638319 RepID=UPI000BBBC7DA|nr:MULTISPECIES: methane monooxygenase/ammonia monooxygenase subunit A [unclassified Polaromonas]MDO8771295.1 methane monooxygenase/ammonia monooxygenase subunit A [Burkholderiaceae bacterium]MDP3166577.1 methane monooxygenase/ammonia monooxygenase subunit A [Hydrogenophaga sp.]MDI1272603.1 methane monooxygenase/ammonia monooxygenase subunit A [Polaromonas sp.]MDI1339703.1 methane monooxygenase/ammonia monooxygenase subunit A [Polaromonas sp.]MDP2033043.1 methane monooxygenase/ammonia monooxyg